LVAIIADTFQHIGMQRLHCYVLPLYSAMVSVSSLIECFVRGLEL
jgi:hypothetical protein